MKRAVSTFGMLLAASLSVLVAASGCRRCNQPATGPGKPETIWQSPGGEGMGHLARGGDDLYWVKTSESVHVRHGDSTPKELWGGQQGKHIELVVANARGAILSIYDGKSGLSEIILVPKDGEKPTTIAQTRYSAGLAVDGDRVVFTDNGLVRVAKLGEAPVDVVSTSAPPTAVAIRGPRIAWVTRPSARQYAQLETTTLPGGVVTVLAKSIPRGVHETMVALDEGSAYVLDGATTGPQTTPGAESWGFSMVRAIDLASGQSRVAYETKLAIQWMGIFDERVYVWEMDPQKPGQGQLRSRALRGPDDSRFHFHGFDALPFVFDTNGPAGSPEIMWADLEGLHRLRPF